MKSLLVALLFLLLPFSALAQEKHTHSSPYVGQQMREIKSLSAEDIAELEEGGGWGLAKAAELNGMPGPSHVLKMKHGLGLTANQDASTVRIFNGMREDAIEEGRNLIARETALEVGFRKRSISPKALQERIREIETSRSNLRYIHLSAHLEMMGVLKEEQVNLYNDLRGYSP
ncbi:hypothetical protein FS800_22350 [Agrobacterium vitis]|uniref:hypothetical protein n=1 Tax=Rhizobium/Agrobacterium group TaxID=227290 RepID=UPI0008721E25|nr:MULTISPECIES: hypothetical protein [Rhizobium/Agrobacterium group]MCF1464072.1 hypothetical protein [Allorhizobium ampelinum]MCF1484875.1 hypothetical protein [Allorhizobium ampelinum]MUO72000.1 hypothetical protein [Agrobacterium vitis]